MLKDMLISFKFVWMILSIIGFFTVMIPILDKKKNVYHLIPICPSKLEHKTCILCGSSTSFYLIGNGEYEKAKEVNPIAFYLYFLIILNTILFILLILTYRIKLQIGS